MPKTLYICYFGLREPLVQTQVIPYLKGIAKDGLEVSLLTFEPKLKGSWPKEQIQDGRRSMNEIGIEWHHLAYHKRPSVPATLYDIFVGALKVRKLIIEKKLDVLHCRVHVPALMASIARKFSGRKPKIIFDIRGFFPEEYTDAGVWPKNGLIYRIVKRVEKWLLDEADAFVVLTKKARDVLFPESSDSGFDKLGRPVEVIPCCVDFDSRFSSLEPSKVDAKRHLGIEDRFVVVHLGALGGLYLSNEIANFLKFSKLHEPRTFAILLTQSDPAEIVSLLKNGGFAESDYLVRRVDPDDVPGYLRACDVAISFVKNSFSTLSRSPTKIPEYLACGVPIVANSGVGDVDQLITDKRVGSLIKDFSDQSFLSALNNIRRMKAEGDLDERCRNAAREGFDLRTTGRPRYLKLYRRLLDGK
jgi:glycosyltransferase involved in cell wall biosynthesis